MTEGDFPELGPDRTLLLVDDDAAFVNRLARAMEKRGFVPETAESVAAGRAMRLQPRVAAVAKQRGSRAAHGARQNTDGLVLADDALAQEIGRAHV